MLHKLSLRSPFITATNLCLSKYGIKSAIVFQGARLTSWLPLVAALQMSGLNAPTLAFAGCINIATKHARLPIVAATAPVFTKLFPQLQLFQSNHLFNISAPQVAGPLKKYGAGMFVSKRSWDVISLAAIYYGLNSGLDVTGALESTLGYSATRFETVNPWMAAMTAATVTNNTILLPIHAMTTFLWVGHFSDAINDIQTDAAPMD
jgi:hypothetical protein